MDGDDALPSVNLSNGTTTEINGKIDLYGTIIREILIPFYQTSNDWPEAIRVGLKELKNVGKNHPDLQVDNRSRQELLDVVHDKLSGEIGDLPGVDKIEILFLDLDDYMEDIQRVIKSHDSPEDLRMNITGLIQGLTEFELGELVVELAKIADWTQFKSS